MTFLPENIFKNILSYCDDRIERRQRQLRNSIHNHISYADIGSREFTYQNYIDYGLIYAPNEIKALEVRNTIVLNGYIFPNIFFQ